jgi:hypothetical protein
LGRTHELADLQPYLSFTPKLTDALCQLLEDYSMVSFIPLNIREEDSVEHVLATVDHAIQYGEDLEVRAAENDDFDTNAESADE